MTPNEGRFVSAGDSSCFVLAAGPVMAAAAAFSEARRGTHYEFEERAYWLVARVLLPGEDGCGPVFDGS